jgi:hypothetical protein
MDERYGASASQGISDTRWIEEATAHPRERSRWLARISTGKAW